MKYGYFHSKETYDLIVGFLGTLCHVKGEWAGQRFEPAKWQLDRIIRPLFCTLCKCSKGCRGDKCKSGKFHPRRYRICYVEIPRKNGKSFVAAAVALILLFLDKEAGAEVYSVAGDRDQAKLVFGVAKVMVAENDLLAPKANIYVKSIEVPSTNSYYQVLSADAPTKHGLNPHGVIFDELHVQRSAELYETLHTGVGSRRQPLEFLITTAGSDKLSVCYQFRRRAEQVLDGTIKDDSFLPVIFAADEDDDWTDPKTWEKANPNLDVSVKREYIEAECQKAQENPYYENTFKRLHLNLWTEQDVRWIPMASWGACQGAPQRRGVCVAGVDLASTEDLTAVVLYWPETHSCEAHFFVPEEGVVRRSRDSGVPYDAWVRDGFITATEGNRTDYAYVRNHLNDLRESRGLNRLVVDRWNASHLINELQEDGFEVVEVGFTIPNMSAPAKELESLIADGKLRHGANPVLTWNASNVAVKSDPEGNIMPSKHKSGDKIDGIAALVLAILGAKGAATPEVPYWDRPDAKMVVGEW